MCACVCVHPVSVLSAHSILVKLLSFYSVLFPLAVLYNSFVCLSLLFLVYSRQLKALKTRITPLLSADHASVSLLRTVWNVTPYFQLREKLLMKKIDLLLLYLEKYS